MASVTVSKEIAAPVERVFEVVTDLENAPANIRGIAELEILTEPPIGVGTRFKETRVMFGKKATEEMEVVALEKPHLYALGCESTGCRYHTEFRFSPDGAGTRLEIEFGAEPLNLMAKMMAFMTKPMLKMCAKALEEDLEDIRRTAEAATSETA